MKKILVLLSSAMIILSLLIGCAVVPDYSGKSGTTEVTDEIDNSSVDRGASSNGTMMQYFHWYYPADGSLWNKVTQESSNLSQMGVTALWLPPSYKGDGGGYDVGYGVYDMYDLGEFNQKGTIRTKYGTKDQYLAAITEAKSKGIQIYADVVFNHRGGADGVEDVLACKVDSNNRNIEISGSYTISAWTKFDFPGRNNAYSSFKWRWYHFDGVDWDQKYSESAIFKFKSTGKAWDWTVTSEKGNYDYLMYADIDFDHPEVVKEKKDWGLWYLNFTNVDGFRLDAVKHIKYEFFEEWIRYLRTTTGKSLFTVGEFWDYELAKLNDYIDKTHGTISMFDAPLHMNFYQASRAGGSYDMRNIINNTLMAHNPLMAVTLVENHDTQPLQALESPVDWWFKPIAYAVILLRNEGYPCVFYADLYGAEYTDKGHQIYMAPVQKLDKLVSARKLYAYGTQRDYRDHWDIIGWTREGDTDHPDSGLAAIMSDGAGGSKWMEVGIRHAGKVFYDYLGNRTDTVVINSSGWGEFKVNGGSVSVWVPQAGQTPATCNVTFTVNNATTYWGQSVYIVGNNSAIGNWNAASAVLMNTTTYPTWSKTIALPQGTNLEFKFIKKDGSGNIVWESGSNRTYTVPNSSTGTFTGTWK